MKQVLKALHQRPIAVYPIYIDLTGSIAGGLLLSQLLYWLEKVDREIWKTDAEIMAETRLTQTEFKNAKKALADLPFISITKRGIPPKTFYAVNWDELGAAIESLISSVTYKMDRRLSTSNRGGNLPNKASLTYGVIHRLHSENTTENTFEPQNKIEESKAQNDILATVHDQVDETAVKVVEIIPSKAKKTKYIYPPTIEELVHPIYEKLLAKKRDHPNIVDCWNWANHQAEAFWLHHDKTGWKIEKLGGAIATWINKAIQYKTVVVPCPIQYKNNPDAQQPIRPAQPAQQERPVLTQQDIEVTAQNVAAVSELFKNMGVRV